MKIKLSFLALVTLFLVSCGGEKIEREAIKAMKSYCNETFFGEEPHLPPRVKADVMFSNDSLCILHVACAELLNKEEYIYLKSSYCLDECNPEMRTNYEFCQSLEEKDERIYCTEQEYATKKAGEIYEGLDYPHGLYYLSTMKINSRGEPVGMYRVSPRADRSELSYIPPLTGTGKWTRDGNFLVLWGKGTFSDSEDDELPLSVQMMAGEDGFCMFKLYEFYDKSPAVRESELTNFHIRSSAEPEGGDGHKFLMFAEPGYNQIGISRPEEREEFKQLLLSGGKVYVTCSLVKDGKRDYSFHLDVTGFDKALEILQTK